MAAWTVALTAHAKAGKKHSRTPSARANCTDPDTCVPATGCLGYKEAAVFAQSAAPGNPLNFLGPFGQFPLYEDPQYFFVETGCDANATCYDDFPLFIRCGESLDAHVTLGACDTGNKSYIGGFESLAGSGPTPAMVQWTPEESAAVRFSQNAKGLIAVKDMQNMYLTMVFVKRGYGAHWLGINKRSGTRFVSVLTPCDSLA